VVKTTAPIKFWWAKQLLRLNLIKTFGLISRVYYPPIRSLQETECMKLVSKKVSNQSCYILRREVNYSTQTILRHDNGWRYNKTAFQQKVLILDDLMAWLVLKRQKQYINPSSSGNGQCHENGQTSLQQYLKEILHGMMS
jgi:hypothetical protein